eukprot:NODE_4942_length_740_cov_33.263386_g4586_i0.p1 GENE.NODE_4942_length_740_cov_33.263386_g4586_i0~~NODE_4942_length_740_cov_33.263386_g4586_i0.p1  ORF type:complete len:130 (+),score=13.52 NODE_4942_length_740_cov_33.263386_g4586_i0:220-609(+)
MMRQWMVSQRDRRFRELEEGSAPQVPTMLTPIRLSGYQLFLRERYRDDKDSTLATVGAAWRALTDVEREAYRQRAVREPIVVDAKSQRWGGSTGINKLFVRDYARRPGAGSMGSGSMKAVAVLFGGIRT